MKASAASYIDDIKEKTLWSNSQWTEANECLPPRFGIVTSNTAESVNSMFNAARDLPWMDAVEKIIDVMIRRICACRKKYERNEDAFKILPNTAGRIMNARWEATASISVMELEAGSGVYTMSTCDYDGGVEDEEDEDERRRKIQSRKDRLPSQHSSTHIVKPAHMWCSCGVWQDTLLPCRHACAVYRHNKRTCSAKAKVKPTVGIEQSDTLIEEATDVLLRLQEKKDENEEEDNEETKDEQRTTEDNTESLPVP
ncbi:hypothetical protein MHU86_5343 [Fragilaria crotonensis]|nr:hypothetical protein MHU86_5343 [Fragilaria crotonensis]